MTKRDELIALGGVGAKVKPLEWSIEDRHYIRIHNGRGLGLRYQAASKVYSSGWIVTLGEEVIYNDDEADEDAAKAAAQADYETRILSALEAPAAGDGEPVAWQFLCADGVWRDCLPPPEYDLKQNKGRFRQLYTAPPSDAAMREAVIEECARELETSYPDHAWLNAACAAIRALTAPGATTKSDGGVEGHAEYRQGLPVSVGDKKASNAVDVASETDDAATGHPRAAGVEPGPSEPKNYFFETEEEAAEAADNGRNTGGKSYYRPSEPSSTRSEVTASLEGDAVERVARIVNPDAFCSNPDPDEPEFWRKAARHLAREKARAILATVWDADTAAAAAIRSGGTNER